MHRSRYQCDFERSLLQSDVDVDRDDSDNGHSGDDFSKWFKLVIILQFVVIIGLLYPMLLADVPLQHIIDAGVDLRTKLYSPAQDVLEHELVKFGGEHIFQAPPSEEVDAAWEGLYQFGVSTIAKSQAALLPNKTYPVSYNTSQYLVQLSVFHQLHCLNQIRKGLHREYYTRTLDDAALALLTPVHLAHCLNLLRQSLMCAADVSPLVWQWNPGDKRAEIRFDVVHSCRNFEKVANWAREHHVQTAPDLTVEIEDDVVIPKF